MVARDPSEFWRGVVRKLFLVVFSLCELCLLNGCGGGAGSSSQQPPPATATHFSVSAPSAATSGTPFNITVNALDATNNVAGSYSGTVHFTSSDTKAVLPPDSVLKNGTATFQATLNTVGSQTITGTDTVTATIVGTSSTINATAMVIHFSVTAPPTATTGTPFNITVNALDATNNVAGSFSDTVHFASTDTKAVLPDDSMLTNGTATLQATLNTDGGQTITATDKVMVSVTGTSNTVNASGPATHFSVSAPPTATVGTAFDFTLTALDALNNVATGYSGMAHFTSTDGQADLPADSVLTNGTANLPAGLKTIGSQTITSTDTLTASITGTSKSIKVGAATPENPVPLINQPLSPDAVVSGEGGVTMTVDGTGFVSGSVVNWNGKPRVTSFVSASKLTATVLATDIATFNAASVTVFNPPPGGGTSNVVFFEITRPTSAVALNTPANFNAGPSPLSVATGDFNGDGKLDLVATNFNANNVSVLLGNGDGTFQAAVDYGVGLGPHSVVVGDFNGDGKLDLAVANMIGNNVSVLLGKGDGTFQVATVYNTGSAPSSVTVGDFNRDGQLDLVVANEQSNNVSVLLGNGDGTFQAALNYPAGLWSSSVAAGDFNGDGNLDLAVANLGANNVSILLGNGDGTFQPAVNYVAGSACQSVAIGDLNGDGKLDLAVVNVTTNDISILLGNGDGTFQVATNYSVGTQPQSLALGDLNGDGSVDVAVANNSTRNVSILLGNGDGTFQPSVNYDAGTPSQSVAVGDLNGDGRLDVAVANGASSTVSVLLQPGLVSGPNATWSFPSLTFGTQVVGTVSPAQSIVLINYGTATLNITSIAASAAFSETNCGSSLSAGASCTIQVSFSPSAQGAVNGTLTVTDDTPGNPQTVSLSGTGTTSAAKGSCEANSNVPHRLTGNCITPEVGPIVQECTFQRAPASCPVGALPINKQFKLCGFEVKTIDRGRTCP
jgi:hypothetical protein